MGNECESYRQGQIDYRRWDRYKAGTSADYRTLPLAPRWTNLIGDSRRARPFALTRNAQCRSCGSPTFDRTGRWNFKAGNNPVTDDNPASQNSRWTIIGAVERCWNNLILPRHGGCATVTVERADRIAIIRGGYHTANHLRQRFRSPLIIGSSSWFAGSRFCECIRDCSKDARTSVRNSSPDKPASPSHQPPATLIRQSVLSQDYLEATRRRRTSAWIEAIESPVRHAYRRCGACGKIVGSVKVFAVCESAWNTAKSRPMRHKAAFG